ncbi:signal transduction histidine kinase [Pseudoduganella flava]|uniref:histidine kinase n=1 Tax=Pseudoduganella flava TaxID=871742 RepID=A0A562Q0X6_9BURK|nr:hybrid sensor histidine kinase/response regulator [Pseudoduganella flava]QGZ38161.1 response regulator [Pseudoduganella flava]TWI50317.1 signal transduction histidine kinase [Pseudoduganella flava]
MHGPADAGRARIENLRLSLHNVRSSVWPPICVALAMTWALFDDAIGLALLAWCAALIACQGSIGWYSSAVLRRDIGAHDAARIQHALLALNVLYGVAWGSLVWVTLDTASNSETILVNSVIAGVAASAMSVLASTMPVFAAFVLAEFATAAGKFVQIDDPAYHALLVALMVYFLALLMQGRNCAKTINSAIMLRFENAELLTRLRAESVKATAAHHQAVEANLAKSRFMVAASHDLRQPAHALGMFLETLARGELSAAQRRVLENARSASQASADMLNTLLDMSRIDAGVIEASTRPFALQEILNRIERELAPQGDAKGLVYRTRDTDALCESDPALVELILRNFVTNAIRYTERGGVLVGARARGDRMHLEVWDTGIGIDPSKFHDIFREFHQLNNPERDRSKGLGLGLAIADGLARKLGHRLELASRPGRGSVFRLVLPRAARTPHAGEHAAPAPAPAQPQLHAHVLVIDDDAAVRTGMAMLLQGWGCTCDVVEAPEQALAAARARLPDVVISDFRLRENHTGTEVIAALGTALGRPVRALLITGDTGPERLREAQRGGLPLLYKPVSPLRLHAALRGLCEPQAANPPSISKSAPVTNAASAPAR